MTKTIDVKMGKGGLARIIEICRLCHQVAVGESTTCEGKLSPGLGFLFIGQITKHKNHLCCTKKHTHTDLEGEFLWMGYVGAFMLDHD